LFGHFAFKVCHNRIHDSMHGRIKAWRIIYFGVLEINLVGLFVHLNSLLLNP